MLHVFNGTNPVALSSRGNFSKVCCTLSFQEGIKHSHRWEVSPNVLLKFCRILGLTEWQLLLFVKDKMGDEKLCNSRDMDL